MEELLEALQPSGTPVVSALESFYGRDIDDLAAWARSTFRDAQLKDWMPRPRSPFCGPATS